MFWGSSWSCAQKSCYPCNNAWLQLTFWNKDSTPYRLAWIKDCKARHQKNIQYRWSSAWLQRVLKINIPQLKESVNDWKIREINTKSFKEWMAATLSARKTDNLLQTIDGCNWSGEINRLPLKNQISKATILKVLAPLNSSCCQRLSVPYYRWKICWLKKERMDGSIWYYEKLWCVWKNGWPQLLSPNKIANCLKKWTTVTEVLKKYTAYTKFWCLKWL